MTASEDAITVQRANSLFKLGKFYESLSLYKTLEAKHEWSSLLRTNILLCRHRLSEKLKQNPSQYKFALIRILGNDLPSRHSEDQTYDNLKFTLKNESDFKACKKIWILNRIADNSKKKRIIGLLSNHDKAFIDIRYDLEELGKIHYDFGTLPMDNWQLTTEHEQLEERLKLVAEAEILRQKNLYLMNNNGARNTALREGKKVADWVFPWDGNCFLTDSAWESITSSLRDHDYQYFHIVPMDRVTDNSLLLKKKYRHNACEEPQIIFRKDTTLEFNETLVYGQQPKVELLKRLGVNGPWDKWLKLRPWDTENLHIEQGSYTGNFQWSGWTARLNSGKSSQEKNIIERGIMRSKGIISMIKFHDHEWHYKNFSRLNLTFYNFELMKRLKKKIGENEANCFENTIAVLKEKADLYLTSPLFSVLDKTTLAPSGNIHDYWHPAPYYWPDETKPDGIPYIKKDGKRVPGTIMYEAESIKYDRTAIQRVFDQSTTLAIAGYIFSNPKYTEKAANLIKRWFVDKRSSMNPNLSYSQVRMGHNNNLGNSSGVIETKDFYFFLDAVRLISKSEFFSDNDEAKMIIWCKEFLEWLNNSESGEKEVRANNNHGIAFDLQAYALSAYIGDTDQMHTISLRALSRMKDHFEEDGNQPHEMKRTLTAHYTAFNLHLWLNLNVLLCNTSSFNLLTEERSYSPNSIKPLEAAVNWVLNYSEKKWSFEQISDFNKQRYQHLYHTTKIHSPHIKDEFVHKIKKQKECTVSFHPHDGIAPFWTLQKLDLA